jgi:hypothetical protein
MKKLISIICIALAFVSCTGKKGYLKFKSNNPVQFAKDCYDAFPIKETFIKGKDSIIERTLTVKGDSIPCPAVQGSKPIYVKCPDAKVIYKDVIRVDTFKQVDTRLQVINSDLIKQNNELKAKIEDVTKVASNRLWWVISLAILLLGAIYFIVRY